MSTAKENSKESKAKMTEAAMAARVAADKKKPDDVKLTLAQKLGQTDSKPKA
jgi:hypothetical protein